jgi:chromosomal replication initiation ATPase DnaA
VSTEAVAYESINYQGVVRLFPDVNTVRNRLVQRSLFTLAQDIADRCGFSVNTLLGRGRTASVMRGRRELYSALRDRGLSYPEIGWLLGRDHTTVLYGVRAWRRENGHVDVRIRVAV